MRDPTAFWAPWRRSVRFVAQLAEKHGAERGRQPAAGRVFIRPATTPVWWALVKLWARTEIVLTRGARLSRATQQRRAHDVASLVLARAGRAAPTVGPVAVAGARAVAEAARLMVRASRVERSDGRHAPSVVPVSRGDGGRADVAGAPPIARVLRRSIPTQPPAEISDAGWGKPSATRVFSQATAFPPAELERVADHVIQTMDRRLRAHRERHGRA